MIRWGLLIFVAFVVWQNLTAFFSISLPLLDPFGFAAFLSTLGFVAARSTLRRDQQLKEIQNELEVAHRIQLSILPGNSPFPPTSRGRPYVPMTSVAAISTTTSSPRSPGWTVDRRCIGSWGSRRPYRIDGEARGSFATVDCCRSLSVPVRHEFGSIGQYAEPIRYSSIYPPELRIRRTALLRSRAPTAIAGQEWRRHPD